MSAAASFTDADVISRVVLDALGLFALYTRTEPALKVFILVDSVRSAMSAIYGWSWILLLRFAEILMVIQLVATLTFIRKSCPPVNAGGLSEQEIRRRERVHREVDALSRPLFTRAHLNALVQSAMGNQIIRYAEQDLRPTAGGR